MIRYIQQCINFLIDFFYVTSSKDLIIEKKTKHVKKRNIFCSYRHSWLHQRCVGDNAGEGGGGGGGGGGRWGGGSGFSRCIDSLQKGITTAVLISSGYFIPDLHFAADQIQI